MQAILTAKAFAAGKSVFFTWILAGGSMFGLMEAKTGDPAYAITWAAISALGAAFITGSVKVLVSLINTSRSRREQSAIERADEIKRLHDFYALRLAFLSTQLSNETNVLRVVRAAKHSLISDVGARDAYIDTLQDILRDKGVEFERLKFRNLAEAFQAEDEQVAAIVQKEISSRPRAIET